MLLQFSIAYEHYSYANLRIIHRLIGAKLHHSDINTTCYMKLYKGSFYKQNSNINAMDTPDINAAMNAPTIPVLSGIINLSSSLLQTK
ncbi:hypothetical protein BOTCAL_0064g00200 [Botryotinia calthae]|uniref:Uncharacterized protein n=1 Tax=Botryotinia calthae TaxID=38488 RepID=A0A4Y8D9H1_9HELO|nr:hypothetical protein BOTCAL_0064g00200 [Botryotinia calthae]